MRKALFIAAILIALSAGLAAAATRPAQMIGTGQLIALIPLENGDAVTLVESGHLFRATYYQQGMEKDSASIEWQGDNEPEVTARACGATLHVVFTEGRSIYYWTWQMPSGLHQVFLPVVCR